MVDLVRNVRRILNSMFASLLAFGDTQAVKTLSVSITLFIFVLVMFFFVGQWLNLETENDVTNLMSGISSSPYAVYGVICVFVLLALTGFPQILLITATIITFGIVAGAFNSWLATMVSASLTFVLGRKMGGPWVVKLGGERMAKTMGFLSRHGIVASGLVRVVPSAPFIVVNAAAGAANIPFWKYCLGTSIGIIPKIAFVALLFTMAPDGASLQQGVGGIKQFFQNLSLGEVLLIGLFITCWLGFLVLMRRLYLHLRH